MDLLIRSAFWYSTLPPPYRAACPSSRGRRSPLLTRPRTRDLPHNLPISCPSPPNRNHTPLSRRLITHGQYSASARLFSVRMLPHPVRRHRHFPDLVMRLPRLPLRLANCSSLEVLRATVYVMIYTCSQLEISPQPSCKPAERLLAPVSDQPPRWPAASF